MAKHLALVEDDAVLRDNYAELLRDEGFEVSTFADRREAMAFFQQQLPDLVLLDITLGPEREAGFELCGLLRARASRLPILFLTSHQSDIDKISGLRLGADDYLTKDISMDYLVVRIETLLRRIETLSAAEDAGQDRSAHRQTVGSLTLDGELLTAFWQDRAVALTLTQFWLVRDLALHRGRVRSYAQLMHAAHSVVEPNTISAHIRTIRERFRAIDGGFDAIKTERGIGYRWHDAPPRLHAGQG